MKASLKFREEQKPLIRAKIPISILGLPFLSAISAGDSKELRLDLVTAFESGPSLRASYRPNDASNPFTFSIKSGIGSLGSPSGAPMSMTAEFNFLTGSSNPMFTVLFKPKFGDFSFKKIVASPAVMSPAVKKVTDIDSDGDSTAVWVDSPPSSLGLGKGASMMGSAGFVNGLSSLLTGAEVSARSVLPLKSNAAVKFRWGVRLPEDKGNGFNIASFSKLPLLVMSKISIEHAATDYNNKKNKDDAGKKGADVAEACMEVKRQLEAIKAESSEMKKAVEEIRGLVPVTTLGGGGGGGKVMARGIEGDVSRGRSHLEGSGRARVNKEEEKVNEELKKALMGAAGGSGK